jgi:hypothetical protein
VVSARAGEIGRTDVDLDPAKPFRRDLLTGNSELAELRVRLTDPSGRTDEAKALIAEALAARPDRLPARLELRGVVIDALPKWPPGFNVEGAS